MPCSTSGAGVTKAISPLSPPATNACGPTHIAAPGLGGADPSVLVPCNEPRTAPVSFEAPNVELSPCAFPRSLVVVRPAMSDLKENLPRFFFEHPEAGVSKSVLIEVAGEDWRIVSCNTGHASEVGDPHVYTAPPHGLLIVIGAHPLASAVERANFHGERQ